MLLREQNKFGSSRWIKATVDKMEKVDKLKTFLNSSNLETLLPPITETKHPQP